MNEVMSVRCVRMNEAERRVVYWLHGRTHDETDVFTNILLIVATMVATINSTAPRPAARNCVVVVEVVLSVRTLLFSVCICWRR